MGEEEIRHGAQITTPIGSLKFFGANLAEFVLVIILCLVSVGAYVAWDLREDVRYANRVNFRILQAMRLQNCLATIPIEKREQWLEWCKRNVQDGGAF